MSSLSTQRLAIFFERSWSGVGQTDRVAPVRVEAAGFISATVLTKDSARRLSEVLGALHWCDEVVVLDTGSCDDTHEIAEGFANVSLHRLNPPFTGFGDAHRHAVALARNDWILSVDSDEVISPELAREIQGLQRCSRSVYTMPFHNHFNGRLIRSCGWFPDRHRRLFDRTVTNFCRSEVHEKVITNGLTVRALEHPIHHFSYDTTDDFLRKMRVYSHLFATQNAGRKSASAGKAVRRSVWAFVKSYLIQRGFLEGYEGFVISAYKAQTTFWKYLLLHEANRRR